MSSIKLVSIHLENFKSFKKLALEDLNDSSLLAIIGLNGTGKSNVIDAFLYILGETNAHILRARNMAKLVNPEGEASKCTVQLNIQREQNFVDLKRSTFLDGRSTYMINNQVVSYNAYLEELKGMGVDCLVRNYFVQQGSIRVMAEMSNKQLGEYLEKICKSIEYKQQFDFLETSLKEFSDKVQAQNGVKNRIKLRELSLKKQVVALQKLKDLKQQHNTQKLHLAVFEACQLHLEMENKLRLKRDLMLKIEKMKEEGKKFGEEIDRDSEKCRETFLVLQQTEAKIVAQTKRVSEVELECIKFGGEIEYFDKRERAILKIIDSTQLKLERNTANKTRLDAELQKFLKNYQEHQTAYQAMPNIEATPEQLLEYHTLKANLAKRLAEETSQGSGPKYSSELKESFRTRLTALENELDSLKELVDFSDWQKMVTTYETELNETLQAIKCFEDQIEANSNKMTENEEELKSKSSERQILVKNICCLSSHNAEESNDAFIKILVNHVPGVLGRLEDLIQLKPQYRHFQRSVELSLQDFLKAIVVEDSSVIEQCEVHMPINTEVCVRFLPLTTLKFDEPSSILGSIEDSVLLSEVLEYDPAHRAAVLYACQNILMVADEEKAKSLSREMGRNLNVISQSGIFYTSNGIITVNDRKAKEKSKNISEIEQMKTKFEILNEEIYALTNIRVEIKQNHEKLTHELKLAKQRQEVLKHAHGENLKLMKKTEADSNNIFKDYTGEMTRCRTFLNKHTDDNPQQIREEQIQTEVFSEFCARYNFNNIRDFENACILATRNLEKQKLQELEISIRECRRQIDIFATNIDEDNQYLATCRAEIQDLQKDRSARKLKLKEATKVLKAEEEKVIKLLEFKATRQAYLRDCGANIAKLNEKHSTIEHEDLINNQNLNRINEEITRHQRHCNLFFDDCMREGITLPRNGNPDDSSSSSNSTILSNIDFGMLPRAQTVFQNPNNLQLIRNSYENKIQFLNAQIAELGLLNYYALEEYEETKNEHVEAMVVYNSLAAEMNIAKTAFLRVQKLRSDKLKDCYIKVNNALDNIYKEVLQTASARAEIFPLDAECPYAGGFSFMCAVPGKSFYSVRELSSGEKSLAALALFYAIRQYHPSPLLLLDEIDSNLDEEYVNNLAEFLDGHREEGFQTIVVTHKPKTASHADELAAIIDDDQGEEQIAHAIVKWDLRQVNEDN